MYEIIDKVIGHQYNLFTYHARIFWEDSCQDNGEGIFLWDNGEDIFLYYAGMAELADALDLGSSV